MFDTSHFDTYDSGLFRQFCGPAQIHKDLNTLYGLIVGIQADGCINYGEIEMVAHDSLANAGDATVETVNELRHKSCCNTKCSDNLKIPTLYG